MSKRTKIYIDPEQAKKKVDRYSYWSIKDETGILISSSEENNPDNHSFAELLNKIISDGVDAEVQIKYGANEASSRNNPPLFIKVNEDIEWVEPEPETVNINGTPHPIDKNGNVNINFSTPESMRPDKIEYATADTISQKFEMQLQGLRDEHAIKEQKMAIEMQNKMAEQMLQFKDMMLSDREKRIAEREQLLAQREADIEAKESDIQENVRGYLKQIPSALGGLFKEIVKEGSQREDLAGANEGQKEEPKPKPRRKVQFSVKTTPQEEIDEYEESEHILEVEPEDESHDPRQEPEPIENETNQ